MPDVTQGLIDSLLHPLLGSLSPHLDAAGPYTGNVTLTTWSSTLGPIFTPQPVRDTSGVIVQGFGAIPPGWGLIEGYDDGVDVSADYYHNRFVQVVVQHRLRRTTDGLVATGPWVTTQLFDVHILPQLILWEVALPGRIGLYTAPGIEVDLYYLMITPPF